MRNKKIEVYNSLFPPKDEERGEETDYIALTPQDYAKYKQTEQLINSINKLMRRAK